MTRDSGRKSRNCVRRSYICGASWGQPIPRMSERGTVILGQHWRNRCAELTYITRSIAGAASRCGPVCVLVPGAVHRREADGAFDLVGIGEVGELRWPATLASDHTVVVDDLTPELASLLALVNPRSVLYLSSSVDDHNPAWRQLRAVSTEVGSRTLSIAPYVPVNPLATLHRHHGFGFTGYQLVLSGRPAANQATPPPAAAWISAAFHDSYVIVVENAVAAAWRGRVLRGTTSVDTRMDLWRLIAHANVCVDLDPGLRSPASASSPCASGRRSSCRSTLGRRRSMLGKVGAQPSVIRASCSLQCGACRPRRTGLRFRTPGDATQATATVTPLPSSDRYEHCWMRTD